MEDLVIILMKNNSGEEMMEIEVSALSYGLSLPHSILLIC